LVRANNNNLASELSYDITLLIKEISEFIQVNSDVLHVIKPKSASKTYFSAPFCEGILDVIDYLCSSKTMAPKREASKTQRLLKFYNSYFTGGQQINSPTFRVRFQNILLVPYILDKLACCFKKVCVFVPMSYYVCDDIYFYITLYNGAANKEYLKNFDTIWRPVNLGRFVNFITIFLSFILDILKEGYNFAYDHKQYREFPFTTTAVDKTVLLKYLKSIQDEEENKNKNK
jgi:hypothetical protein